MRAIREILHQHYEFERSLREVSRSVRVSFGTVRNVVRRAEKHGLSWPLPAELDDEELERLLFRQPQPAKEHPLPDMAKLDRELRGHKGVTLLVAARDI